MEIFSDTFLEFAAIMGIALLAGLVAIPSIMKKITLLLIITLFIGGCNPADVPAKNDVIGQEVIAGIIESLKDLHPEKDHQRITRGVKGAAALWRSSDGTPDEFRDFCIRHFISDPKELDEVFDKLAHYFEHLYGYMNRISLELNRYIHEDRGPVHAIDQLFGSYSASAHIQNDFYNNKTAFIVALNFPSYSLQEKNSLGAEWSAREWGMARLGDYFTERIPPALVQELNQVYSKGRLYISEYNIFAGRLQDPLGRQLFPENMKLLAHWNIRDEIRSNYGQADGYEKQDMLYQVMLRIINQDIPQEVINSDKLIWDPYSNTLYDQGTPVSGQAEGGTRYAHLLDNFLAIRNTDPYYQGNSNYIIRRFENSMEIPQEEVEALFREYAASPLLRDVGRLISSRLGRELRPFDLWYDGFKSRSSHSEEYLDAITKRKYPDAESFQRALPGFLYQLGFSRKDADFIASRIEVDAARGSGHAWRASMRSKPSHLRTRIGTNGMDYKGYNIAIHEYGHNVEQTISIQMTDNFFISGIPNTAFTEALAFMFQRRDLALLGVGGNGSENDALEVLDIFWDNYEMMGVSLVDMGVWKWLYENPEANVQELQQAVLRIAKDVWNEFFADVFGERDIPLLAIYSHMIQSPLYLSNYPYGRLIMFQLEDYIRDKDFASEVIRMFSLGQLTPGHWMQKATGSQISNTPIFDAVARALQSNL